MTESVQQQYARILNVYRELGRTHNFGFEPETGLRTELLITKSTEGTYFHKFTRPELPAPIRFSYYDKKKCFEADSLLQAQTARPHNRSRNMFPLLRARVDFFGEFNDFLQEAGYSVTESVECEEAINFIYKGIRAQSSSDVRELGAFLLNVNEFLRGRQFFSNK